MSRLDPARELQEFLDAIEASREREPGGDRPQPERHGTQDRTVPAAREDQLSPDPPSPEVPFDDSRRVLYDRGRGYRLRTSEIRTLSDLGTFRIVGPEDLAQHIYQGHGHEMREDLRNLSRQGLIRAGTFEGPEASPRHLWALTERGHRLLLANRVVPKDQSLYYGFVKPREANHDADLYKLYHQEAAGIVKKGGRNLRVVLDFELQRKINRDVATFGREARPEIAERHGLQMVRGKIPIPDVRIEYEKPDGDMVRVDLELVTEHYHGRSLADKVNAGFSLYTPRGEADRLRRVLDQKELTAEILSL